MLHLNLFPTFDRASRNYINVRLCDAAVAVSPTGGTVTEVAWMLKLGKPCAFYGSESDLGRVRMALGRFPVDGPLTRVQDGEDLSEFFGRL